MLFAALGFMAIFNFILKSYFHIVDTDLQIEVENTNSLFTPFLKYLVFIKLLM